MFRHLIQELFNWTDWEYEDHMYTFKMILVAIFIFIVASTCVFGGAFGIAAVTTKQSCNEYIALDTTHEYVWNFWTGCKVKTINGFWVSPGDLGSQELYIKEMP